MSRKKYRICLMLVLTAAVVAVIFCSEQISRQTVYKDSVLVQQVDDTQTFFV